MAPLGGGAVLISEVLLWGSGIRIQVVTFAEWGSRISDQGLRVSDEGSGMRGHTWRPS